MCLLSLENHDLPFSTSYLSSFVDMWWEIVIQLIVWADHWYIIIKTGYTCKFDFLLIFCIYVFGEDFFLKFGTLRPMHACMVPNNLSRLRSLNHS